MLYLQEEAVRQRPFPPTPGGSKHAYALRLLMLYQGLITPKPLITLA
jgi:hypothetical protein